jgi:hypothetical protein
MPPSSSQDAGDAPNGAHTTADPNANPPMIEPVREIWFGAHSVE